MVDERVFLQLNLGFEQLHPLLPTTLTYFLPPLKRTLMIQLSSQSPSLLRPSPSMLLLVSFLPVFFSFNRSSFCVFQLGVLGFSENLT